MRKTKLMDFNRLQGLIAATYTPISADGQLNLVPIQTMVDGLIDQGIGGLYVGGSTGEGMSLCSDERKRLAAAFVEATAGRIPVIVQVGHNSLAEASALAAHARDCGANAISATCPSYFKINSEEVLVESIANIAAAAPDLPFYYYHIPLLTGSSLNMVKFLRRASILIPNLVGLKYTDTRLHEFQACLELDDGRFDVVWGCDEMLLGALAVGGKAAIGSTYNFMSGIYRQVIQAFGRGDLVAARRNQAWANAVIELIGQFPFHPAVKQIFRMQGIDLGQCRLPQPRLDDEHVASLRQQLDSIRFFEVIAAGVAP